MRNVRRKIAFLKSLKFATSKEPNSHSFWAKGLILAWKEAEFCDLQNYREFLFNFRILKKNCGVWNFSFLGKIWWHKSSRKWTCRSAPSTPLLREQQRPWYKQEGYELCLKIVLWKTLAHFSLQCYSAGDKYVMYICVLLEWLLKVI